ncbi:hypothetical protein [Aliidiomarina soli]|uniref:Uncharacterized protein n=1 Tax=Aliidiomarina soli TaxID=1928574 RepID=A0A432WEJ0_9GAMM|nr:hypothetical protein [Aliidiomarina soli]RUO31240.1 hypothetical protein CWE14_12170 [Aliidiomarina soli]
MKYKCDIEFLERRLKWLKWLNYGFLIPCIVAIYFKPSIFFVNGSLTTGVVICVVTLSVLRFIDKHYEGALYNHRSDTVILSGTGLEFFQHDSGYSFKRDYKDIVSVEYFRFLGTPKVKLRFTNNEFYDLVWFKDSNALYSKLKSK